MDDKLFVICRQDLTTKQQAVQSGHAVAEWLLHSSQKKSWKNGTLVYLGAKNKKVLSRICKFLEQIDKCFTEFREPYYKDSVTAIASLGDCELFKELELL